MPDDFPHIPPHLVDALEARFPDRTPDPKQSYESIQQQIGASRVVRFLREVARQQADEQTYGGDLDVLDA